MDAIYKTEFEHHSVKAIIVALNRWFGNEGKLPVKCFDAFIGYSDFCIDEPYVDTQVHLDGRPSHHYNGSTWDSNTDCPNRPKNAAYAAIEYLREEHGIFYSPQMEPDNDHKTKDELKARTDADYWFDAARKRLTEIEKLRKEIKDQTKHNMDYTLNAFREILDALKIDKSEYIHMDIPSLTRFAIMEAEKAASNLDNYRLGAVKFASDYSSLQKEKEKLEKDLKHMTDWNADLEKTLIAARANLADILKELGVSRSNTIGLTMDILQHNAVKRASLIKYERDKYLKEIGAAKAIDGARNERLHELVIKISRMYQKLLSPDPNETCACTAERQLEVIESYISELRTHNEALRKDNKDSNKWIAKYNDLRNRCNSVFGAGGFVTKQTINDLCDEYTIVRPGDDEDCKESLRYIFDILKECRDEANKLSKEVKSVSALDFYKLLCEYCDKYQIQKPSSVLTLEECVNDILKRFKETLKENQDFRYTVEQVYVGMTDQTPPKYMTILGILKAIGEEVDDREAEYNRMEEQWAKADALRKEWHRKYESEHERANGEHKKADKYWAQVAGLQTRIKNLEDALNNAASNATGYEALKSTLRKTLDSEVRLKKELDTCREQLKAANDAIRKQNEAILHNERLDEPTDKRET